MNLLLLQPQIKIRINTDMPVQVDGEPWIQAPGEVVILKSALKVCVFHFLSNKMFLKEIGNCLFSHRELHVHFLVVFEDL